MAEPAILINGLPGAGKRTLSRAVGEELNGPVVSKDTIKETLADIGHGRISSRRPPPLIAFGPRPERAPAFARRQPPGSARFENEAETEEAGEARD